MVQSKQQTEVSVGGDTAKPPERPQKSVTWISSGRYTETSRKFLDVSCKSVVGDTTKPHESYMHVVENFTNVL